MDKFMQTAVDEAKATAAEGGLPYGAALVREGEIIAPGRNLQIQNNDPTSHAEMEAIRNAGHIHDYSNTIMYASAFPCMMCAGAIAYHRIPKVIVGAAWSGSHVSQAFLEANGIEVEVLDLNECKELIR